MERTRRWILNFLDAVLYWVTIGWMDFLIDHPAARILFSIAVYLVSYVGAIYLLVYLKTAGYIP